MKSIMKSECSWCREIYWSSYLPVKSRHDQRYCELNSFVEAYPWNHRAESICRSVSFMRFTKINLLSAWSSCWVHSNRYGRNLFLLDRKRKTFQKELNTGGLIIYHCCLEVGLDSRNSCKVAPLKLLYTMIRCDSEMCLGPFKKDNNWK